MASDESKTIGTEYISDDQRFRKIEIEAKKERGSKGAGIDNHKHIHTHKKPIVIEQSKPARVSKIPKEKKIVPSLDGSRHPDKEWTTDDNIPQSIREMLADRSNTLKHVSGDNLKEKSNSNSNSRPGSSDSTVEQTKSDTIAAGAGAVKESALQKEKDDNDYDNDKHKPVSPVSYLDIYDPLLAEAFDLYTKKTETKCLLEEYGHSAGAFYDMGQVQKGSECVLKLFINNKSQYNLNVDVVARSFEDEKTSVITSTKPLVAGLTRSVTVSFAVDFIPRSVVGIVELHVESHRLGFSDYIQVPVFLYNTDAHLLGNTRDIGPTTRANVKDRVERHFGMGSWDKLGVGVGSNTDKVSNFNMSEEDKAISADKDRDRDRDKDDASICSLVSNLSAGSMSMSMSISSRSTDRSTVSSMKLNSTSVAAGDYKSMGKSFATPRSVWYVRRSALKISYS